MGEAIIQETSNGTLMRGADGKFLPGTRPNNVITSANARSMAQRRIDKAAAAARARVLAHVKECGTISPNTVLNTPIDAWGELVGHAAELAMSTDSARGVADLSRFVGQATQMLSNDKQQQEAAPAPIQRDTALLYEALRIVLRERGYDVIDGQARDVGEVSEAE